MIIQTFALLSTLACTFATWTSMPSHYRHGDVILGGMFPLHFNVQREDNYDLLAEPSIPVCKDYNFRGFRWMQAMLFAVEEINNSSTLLSDIELGWKIYDTCDTMSRAVTQALSIINPLNASETVSAVIGPTGSDKSIGVANIFGVFDLPQISYGSTSRVLSDKNNFNSFLRTIPNDDEQATAIVDLLDFYNWTWVGAIAGDDEYGRPGISKFREEAKERGICVEFVEYVSKNLNDAEMKEVAKRVQTFNATVFVLFISGSDLRPLTVKLKEIGVRDKIWVASEAWATSRSVLKEGGFTMHGTLGIATRGGEMKGFRGFLESVSPSSQSTSPFIKNFWEEMFHCACPSDVCETEGETRVKRQTEVTTSIPPCSGNEDLKTVSHNAYLEWTDSELEKSYTAYLAVYTIAHALQNITQCKEGSGLLQGGECPKLDTLTSWQLLAYLRNVDFKPPGSEEKFGFNANGDPNATYKLVSWTPVPNGTVTDEVDFVHVGNYSKQSQERWSLNTGAIYWHDENGTEIHDVPISVCSLPCTAGYYRVKLVSDCCYKCVRCDVGKYSNQTNAGRCERCNDTEMSNENRTACVPKPEEYMRWDDPYGITFTCCTAIGIALTIFTAITFFRYRNTAIVKATNVEISFLLFISISCCFLTPLIFVVKPQNWSCRGRQVSFILSFTLCVAAILVKTLRVLTAFQTTMPLTSRKRSRWLGQHLQILVVLLVALVQVIICVAWLVADPPRATINYNPFDRVLIICDPGSLALMICVHVYLALLALVAFVLAFRARKLPENFNEAKFITFAMLVFFIVWLSFIPAYLSTTGTMQTAVYCIGIFASTYGFLGCIFLPKMYIILIKPERNTSERVRMTTVTHAFRSASRSVVYQINSERNIQSNGTGRNSTDNSAMSKASNNNRVKAANEVDRSPCATRARKNFKEAAKKVITAEVKGDNGRKKSHEYSIEINGKLKSSVTSPSRITSNRKSDLLESRFDVTLQVNFSPEKASKNSSPAGTIRTGSSNNSSKTNLEESHADGDSVLRRTIIPYKQRRKDIYQSIPQNENYSDSEVQVEIRKRKLCKSMSYGDYSPVSADFVKDVVHEVAGDDGSGYAISQCTHARSSSA